MNAFADMEWAGVRDGEAYCTHCGNYRSTNNGKHLPTCTYYKGEEKKEMPLKNVGVFVTERELNELVLKNVIKILKKGRIMKINRNHEFEYKENAGFGAISGDVVGNPNDFGCLIRVLLEDPVTNERIAFVMKGAGVNSDE